MSGYIGVVPLPQATQTRDVFTTSANQTSFATSGYTPGFVDVYLNGVKLVDGTDFTATNGSDVVLASGAATSDTVEVVSYSTYEVNNQAFTGDFSVDGTTFKVDSTNNRVGIGTSSPSSSVDILGTSSRMRLDGSAESFQILSRNTTDSVTNALTFDADTYTFNRAGSTQAVIDSSGNVGIGTSSPQKSLVVSDGGAMGIEFSPDDAGQGYSRILNYDRNASAYEPLYIEAEDLRFSTGASATERMRIDSSGNVGIGTTSPAQKLDVTGGYALLDGLRIGGGDTTNTIYQATGALSLSTGSASGIVFKTNLTDRMAIDASGNVGIGTNVPAYPLHVNGRISYSGAIGEGADTTLSSVSTTVIHAASATWQNQAFYTGGTERMRIDSSGNLLVGTTSDLGGLGGRLQVESGGGRGIVQNLTSGAQRYSEFLYAGSTVGFISTNGSSTTYSTSSDYRLKEDVQPMSGASDRVLALNPVNFAWKTDGARVDGFLAHEVQEFVPEAITGTKDEVDDEGNPVYQGIDQSKLVPLLTAALQEALADIATLKAEVAALKGEPT